ncbi:MBL fold metallo-hydrolase [Paenibacillus sedimenti]|uniref:MBL fold metallo-hydrolase n=1 Tax=Paenibacillus sedimenti TaxID=2770274 RepID=A0A926QJ11_9BACL|nr:MBL fold metallo-hydrolase [Paenibacillus sedimenti]MBD0381236.1 MBL fold metallo-hydrolase [Paenibacillus sedimenti]
MKVTILASGSNGNCIHIKSGNAGVLIDAGRWKRDIEKRLIDNGINPATDIQGICITHAHGDHIRGLTIANKYSIPVFASEGEWKDIDSVSDDLRHALTKDNDRYSMIELGDIHIYPFGVHHDAYEPLGYAIEDDFGNRCCVVFDTGKVDNDMLEMMEGSIYIIEANHDPALVEASDYPIATKARILSDIGHLSNQQTAAALKRLVKGKGERIYLTHLSSSNNTPMHAKAEVMRALLEKGFIEGKHYSLEVVSE